MKISVCVTSYNQRDYLKEAVESVLAQSLRPEEIIIIDDASTDDSKEIISGYSTRYPDLIRPVLNDCNRGVVGTFNLGLEVAGGDYITYLAGDDRWLPSKLEKEARRLKAADRPDGVFSDFYFTNATGDHEYLWAGARQPPQGSILPQVIARDFPRRTLFRTELADLRLWRQVGRFDPSFTIYEDWDVHIRLATRFRYAYIPEPLSEYRRHGGGLSTQQIEHHLAATDRIEQKYSLLFHDLESTHGPYLRRQLAGWRAHLWRSSARDIALKRNAGFRAEALRRYRRSLVFEIRPDVRLLWYLLRPMRNIRVI